MTKESLRKTIELLNEILIENIKKRHLFFERAEQIVLWIVGFSTATIVLLISSKNFDIIKIERNNPLILMIIKNLLLICCFGLSFRILSFFTELLLDNISKSLYGLLKGFQTSLSLIKVKFNDSENAEKIIEIINKEFDWNLNNRKDLNDDSGFIQHLKELYENEFENKEELNKIQDLYLLFYGYKSKKLLNIFQNPKMIYARGLAYRTLFYLTIISFALTFGTLIFLCIELLKEIN